MRSLIVIMLVATALAGCSEAAPEPSQEEKLESEGFTAVETTTEYGAISGVVIDETITPVAGAAVRLLGSQETTTDERGLFAFAELEPGTYFLEAEMLGFNGTQTSVNVEAGEVVTPKILLSRNTEETPYKETLYFKGHASAWLGFASFAAEVIAPGSAGCTCAFELEPNPGVRSFTYEATGDIDIDYSAAPVYGNYYWEFVGYPNQDIRSAHEDVFPLHKRFERDSFDAEANNWLLRITPGLYPHVEFAYEMFPTQWYHMDQPEGWSFINGDA